jgi:hypothetical protein
MSRFRRLAALLLSLALFPAVVLGGGGCRAGTDGASAVRPASSHERDGADHAQHQAPSENSGSSQHASLPCAAAMACSIVADAATVVDAESPPASPLAGIDTRGDRMPARPARAPEPPPPRA